MAEMKVSIDGTVPVTGSLVTTPSGTQNVAVTSPTTFPISGTITSTPSGVQVVSGTVTALPSGTQAVSGTVSTLPIRDPAITGVYAYNMDSIAGVVASNNYMSLYNPIASLKTLILFGVFVSSGTVAPSLVVTPIRGFRATLISGGTLQAVSTITEFISTNPAPVAEVRLGNPTATLGPAFFSSVPANSTSNVTMPIHAVAFPAGTGIFTLAAGEGIVLNTSAGDVDQRWNLGMIWGEM